MANVVDAIYNLLFKPGEQEKYHENPQQYLDETGLDECDPTELYEAVVMAYEKGPVYQGASVNVGGNQGVGGSSQSAGGASSAAPGPAASAPPPPPPLDPTLPPAEALEQTINYYITNTTTTNVDDRDTYTDSSQTVQVGEGGYVGEIDLDNETVTASGDGAVAAGEDVYGAATGDGAVAAGDDINAPVNTGVNTGILADESTFENVAVGDNNQQINDSTNAATGGGYVSDDDVNVDINASGSNVDLENVNFGQDNVIDDSEHYTDSFNQEYTDSFNSDFDTTTTNVDDSYNEQSQVGDDSFEHQQVHESFNEPAAPEAPAEEQHTEDTTEV